MKVRKAIRTRSCTIVGKNIRSLIYLGLYLIVAAFLVARGIFHESSIWFHLSLAGVIVLVISIGILIHYRVLNRTLIEPLITLKEAADEMLDKLDGDKGVRLPDRLRDMPRLGEIDVKALRRSEHIAHLLCVRGIYGASE